LASAKYSEGSKVSLDVLQGIDAALKAYARLQAVFRDPIWRTVIGPELSVAVLGLLCGRGERQAIKNFANRKQYAQSSISVVMHVPSTV